MDLARISLDSGFIVTSALVSFIGILLALELLQRRTSRHGSVNWVLLAGAATSFGAAGMWSMHFLSDRAVEILNKPQIRYSVAGTVGSFFAPIACMGLSFYPMNHSELWSIVETVFSGLVAGGGALAMYFISEASMLNYKRESTSNGSLYAAVISVLFSDCVAFWVFSYFKATWTSNFPKRLACAFLLAGTLSAMQWLLKLGTVYHFTGTKSKSSSSSILSRGTQLVVPLLLGVGCVVGLGTLARMRCVANRKAAERIPQMLLACAFFDKEKRLMVTPEGWVPCTKITNTRLERGFNNLFDVNHPIFCWLYRSSFCWNAIKESFPRMPAEIETMRKSWPRNPEIRDASTDPESSPEQGNIPDRSLLFKLLFLIGANDLATMIYQPVEKVGNLFAGVLDTGTVRKPATRKWGIFKGSGVRELCDHKDVDPEVGYHRTFGRGQAMFLVRTLSREECKELRAAGYRFAPPERILGSFAKSMKIGKGEARKFLGKMQHHSGGERVYSRGVHIACFMARPEFSRGLGVLVREDAKNVLPTTQLPMSKLEPWQMEFLLRMHNFTLDECCEQLQFYSRHSMDENERVFSLQLLRGITELRNQINHPMFAKAQLFANPLEAPSGIPGETSPLNLATLIPFRIMLDIYPNSYISDNYVFVSWRFFACMQRVYKGYPHHGAFVHHMRRQYISLRREDGPEARESGLERARKSLNRVSRNAYDRMRHDVTRASNKWTMPSSSSFTLTAWRSSSTAEGKRSVNRNGQGISGLSQETEGGGSVDILEMLKSRPSFEAPVDNDVAPLDTKTYADILMRVVAQDRGGRQRAMNRIDPSF